MFKFVAPATAGMTGVDAWGRMILCRDSDAAGILPDGFNGKNVKILLRGGVIENVAKGKLSGATLTNNGAVTVNADGDFVFDGGNYLRFDGSGFDFSSSSSWTMDFCFADIGSGRNDFCSAIDNTAPQIMANNGSIFPYVNTDYGAPVTPNTVFVYSIQRNAATNVTTAWMNGVLVKSATWDWSLGFPSATSGYVIGRSLHSGGTPNKLRYFRAANGCQYDPTKNFMPNYTGV